MIQRHRSRYMHGLNSKDSYCMCSELEQCGRMVYFVFCLTLTAQEVT